MTPHQVLVHSTRILQDRSTTCQDSPQCPGSSRTPTHCRRTQSQPMTLATYSEISDCASSTHLHSPARLLLAACTTTSSASRLGLSDSKESASAYVQPALRIRSTTTCFPSHTSTTWRTARNTLVPIRSSSSARSCRLTMSPTSVHIDDLLSSCSANHCTVLTLGKTTSSGTPSPRGMRVTELAIEPEEQVV